MHIHMACVKHFHEKLRVSGTQQMGTTPDKELATLGESLITLANTLEINGNISRDDKRGLRAHLLIEEVGECVRDMGRGDEVNALDGLTDLLYVLLGTAVTFDWPLVESFAEVHMSNMSKVKQDSDPSKDRVRAKGENYVPPDIEKVLKLHRNGQIGRRLPVELPEAIDRAYQNQNPLRELNPAQIQAVRLFIKSLIAGGDKATASMTFAHNLKD